MVTLPRVAPLLLSAATLLVSATQSLAQSAPPRYVVSLGNVTVFNGVSHHTDTDYFALHVNGPSGQSFEKTYGPYNLHKNDQFNLQLSSDAIQVPDDPNSLLTISWAAANSGTSDTQKISSAMANAASTIGGGSDDPYTVIGAILVHFGIAPILANCDTPLFGGSVSFDGKTLASGVTGKQGWHSEGPNMWELVYDYQNIKSGCDTGHYNIQVHIKRLRPFSSHFN